MCLFSSTWNCLEFKAHLEFLFVRIDISLLYYIVFLLSGKIQQILNDFLFTGE